MAAVALGDSFISGEGAGAYAPVADVTGTVQGFPGWPAANADAFFCHRSANASIATASREVSCVRDPAGGAVTVG